MTFRPIDISAYAAIETPSSLGRPPRLEWVAIADLVVDSTYQREITARGRKNVRHIATEFSWAMFSVVVVAPIGSGKYTIVDGQHHTTAAALCGIEKVPCAIIEANRATQARAFKAINGNVTKTHTLHLHHAGVAAGEPRALAIAAACAKAGVTIHRNPTQQQLLKPGETCVVSTIARAIDRFGEASTVFGLKTIVSTGGGNAGLLTQSIIWGVVEVLHDHPEWCGDVAALHDAFDDIDLDETIRKARAAAIRVRGSSPGDQFEALLVEALGKKLTKAVVTVPTKSASSMPPCPR